MSIISRRRQFQLLTASPAPGGSSAGVVTLNPLTKSAFLTLDGTKLVATSIAGAGNGTMAFSTASHTVGKFYVEFTLTTKTTGAGFDACGLAGATFPADTATILGNASGGVNSTGLYDDGSAFGGSMSSGLPYVQGNVVCLAVNLGTGDIWRRINNGTWLGSGTAGDPASGLNPGSEIIAGAVVVAVTMQGSGDVWTVNFGATAYAFTPPVGFGSW